MIHSHEDILAEIDATVDQLIANASVLKKIAHQHVYEDEYAALEKTQESLIAHLIHMDETLKKKDQHLHSDKPLLNSKVHDKLGRSGYLNKYNSVHTELLLPSLEKEVEHYAKKPKIHKRKKILPSRSVEH